MKSFMWEVAKLVFDKVFLSVFFFWLGVLLMLLSISIHFGM